MTDCENSSVKRIRQQCFYDNFFGRSRYQFVTSTCVRVCLHACVLTHPRNSHNLTLRSRFMYLLVSDEYYKTRERLKPDHSPAHH